MGGGGIFFSQKGNYAREDKLGSKEILNLGGVPRSVQSQKWLSYQLELAMDTEYSEFVLCAFVCEF